MAKRLLVALIALIAAWLGSVDSAAAVAEPSIAVTTYTYDAPRHDASMTYSASERGPPTACVGSEGALQVADDRVSNGVSAHPRAATTSHIYTTFDVVASLAHTANTTGTTPRSTATVNGDLTSLQRAKAAAKGGASVVTTERTAAQALKPSEAVSRWDEFLGEGPTTNIHPRTGLPDPDRIVSADGVRSIRFGPHEMGSSPTKLHFHEETWSFDSGSNTWFVDSVLVRVPFPKGAW